MPELPSATSVHDPAAPAGFRVRQIVPELFDDTSPMEDATTTPPSRYREYAPPRALADRVVCTWSQVIHTEDDGHVHDILPDGCADLVWIGEADPIVAGPATRTVFARLPAGSRIVGLRLQPGWAGAALGVPADRLCDLEVPLADLWGPWVKSLARPGAGTREGSLDSALLARLADAPAPSESVRVAAMWLARHPGRDVGDLVGGLDVTDRTLRRQCRAALGYGPKAFQRIMRLQGLLARSRAVPPGGRRSLTDLALASGFADQSHMCRDVLELSGRTPEALLRRT